MMNVLVRGKMLDKKSALRLVIEFARRAPFRTGAFWVSEVANAETDADAAAAVLVAVDDIAFSIAYCNNIGLNRSLHETELLLQAEKIRRFVGNPFKRAEADKGCCMPMKSQ
jgi:hypothetical protein